MMRLILGSMSPRRREILDYFSIPYEQVHPQFDENRVQFEGDPALFASKIALGKAESLSEIYPEAAILTADTIVYKDGKIYGKPLDHEDAFRMLSELSGSWHSVFTAVALSFGQKKYQETEETKVLFNPLTSEKIRSYLKALHYADKAGSYAIQLAGSLIIRRIEGCYYNVMGLPVNVVSQLLEKVGIRLWDHLS